MTGTSGKGARAVSLEGRPGEGTALEPVQTEPGSVRRLGSAIGLVSVSLLDLLALDDITTAGAWMPEILFVLASVPALMVFALYTFRRPPSGTSALTPGSRARKFESETPS